MLQIAVDNLDMKGFKFFAMMLLVSWVAVACTKVDKILPSHTGLWQLTSTHDIYSFNDVVTLDTTITEGLGQSYFADDGTGYRLDAAGKRYQDYTWLVNEDNTVITLTDTAGMATDLEIVEQTRSTMTWFSRVITGGTPAVYRYEQTAIVELVK